MGPFNPMDPQAHASFAYPFTSRRKRRVLFTQAQICTLEHRFNQQKYLTAQERESLAMNTNLSATQVKIWFQNHRYKAKKASEEKKKLAEIKTKDSKGSVGGGGGSGGGGERAASPGSDAKIGESSECSDQNSTMELACAAAGEGPGEKKPDFRYKPDVSSSAVGGKTEGTAMKVETAHIYKSADVLSGYEHMDQSAHNMLSAHTKGWGWHAPYYDPKTSLPTYAPPPSADAAVKLEQSIGQDRRFAWNIDRRDYDERLKASVAGAKQALGEHQLTAPKTGSSAILNSSYYYPPNSWASMQHSNPSLTMGRMPLPLATDAHNEYQMNV